jgi:hypothetical protein
MSIIDVVVGLMWSRSFRAGSRLTLAPLTVAMLAVAVADCASTIALDRAVVAYDTTTADSVAKQLLLNIARARHNQPMHFTGISSIAATYKFSVNAGFGGAAVGTRPELLVPVFATSAEENPTISIAPMQGEEFTQRLLTPFQAQKLTLLLRQGYDVDSLLRLMGAELRLENHKHSLGTGDGTVYYNRPSDREGYPVFRRVMAHLSSVQARHALYVEPLHFQYSWTIPADSVTPEAFQSVYKDFSLTYDAEKRVYRVSRWINGRVIVTNYDPAVLSNEERFLLHEQAEEAPFNDILVDIRPGYPGGELPLHGRVRLRSFHEILMFIGRGIEEEPEYDVSLDPRTPSSSKNPPRTLEILEVRRVPPGVDLSVSLKGYQYAVQPQSGYQWNRKAFSLLYQLFQMTVAAVPPSGPAITISK